MTGSAQRPLLFLDVDGPLIPFGGDSRAYPSHPDSARVAAAIGHPLLARLDPAHGPRLSALPCELVWATTWQGEANECLAPLLGLPVLPVVEWPDGLPAVPGAHWKTVALVSWATGRPFAWVDDEISDADRVWVAAHHPGRALLHRVDPEVGLADFDYRIIASWLGQR
ncbi:hypothetical protein LN042_25945 [Kitasatospora sp. RB6PN24]|uniref:HAD domain-containing protein n=1 Tax=Kitasatospora humi TaxID=2893891 RepID=UPI001E3BD741|nr:HAD domain-containing protein [Kitasatospora humi]MCC9310470.1 hypothetical protein [Kitasatospora humi]